MENKRTHKTSFPWKPFAILGFVLLFLLIFPITITERAPERTSVQEFDTRSEQEKIEALVNSYKAKGYTVRNYYPSYIQLEKNKIEGNPTDEANNLSKTAYSYLGKPVKIILVTNDGRYVGFYKGE